MKRTVVALTMLFALTVVPMAKAEKLSTREAKEAAIGNAMQTKGMWPHKFKSLTCDRTSPSAFRCRLRLRAETRWELKDCTFVTDVAKRRQTKVHVRSRQCTESQLPYLSRGDAWRTMRRVADPRYRSRESWTGGYSYGRISTTKYEFQIEWNNEQERCFQLIKVALVGGKPKGNASEAACVAMPAWPKPTE